VVLVHSLSYAYVPSAYSLPFRAAYTVVMHYVMRRAGCVVTVSESERAVILGHFPNVSGLADRLIAAPNGVSPPEPQRGAPAPRENFGLYVGSLSKGKNIEGVIETAIRLARERGMRFAFVGGGGAAFASASLSIAPDVADKLEFVGQVDDPAVLADYYRRAAVLLFPSHYESSGLPPTEAMSYGCPVVLSRIPSLVERCGDAAEYCDPNDVESIVDAIKRVVTDPLRAEALSRAGRERAALYSWEAQVRGVLAAAARLDATQ
jgi:glycosyltransferase involved in cell wall biosynthesis